jgi:hypothetical protein
VNADSQLEWESRWGPRAAAAAAGAAVLILAGSFVAAAGTPSNTEEITTQLLSINKNRSTIVAGGILLGLGTLLVAGALAYLYRATKFRRPELPPVALFTAIIGPVLLFLTGIVGQIYLTNKAHTFATQGIHDYAQAKSLGFEARSASGGGVSLVPHGSVFDVVQYAGLAGQLALGFGFVLVSLNAMRVGLLTRFMGVLGIISGVLSVIPFGGLQIVQPFWLGALAALFLGRWPSGVPEAWRTGKAKPWPTQQEMREAREKALAARKGEAAPEPEPEPEPAAATAGARGSAHPTSKKRKRKRRR